MYAGNFGRKTKNKEEAKKWRGKNIKQGNIELNSQPPNEEQHALSVVQYTTP